MRGILRAVVLSCAVIFILFIAILAVSYFQPETNGKCLGLNCIPQYGGAFPKDVGTIEVTFKYIPRYGQVFAKARCTIEIYQHICKVMNIRYGYQTGEIADDVAIDPEYVPVGKEIFLGFGGLPGDSRGTVWLYFVPQGGKDGIGELYIHILR